MTRGSLGRGQAQRHARRWLPWPLHRPAQGRPNLLALLPAVAVNPHPRDPHLPPECLTRCRCVPSPVVSGCGQQRRATSWAVIALSNLSGLEKVKVAFRSQGAIGPTVKLLEIISSNLKDELLPPLLRLISNAATNTDCRVDICEADVHHVSPPCILPTEGREEVTLRLHPCPPLPLVIQLPSSPKPTPSGH